MACPNNEFTNDIDGMRDVDGKIRLQSDFPYEPLRENKFDFEAGPILWTLIFAAILAGGLIVATLYMFGVIP